MLSRGITLTTMNTLTRLVNDFLPSTSNEWMNPRAVQIIEFDRDFDVSRLRSIPLFFFFLRIFNLEEQLDTYLHIIFNDEYFRF